MVNLRTASVQWRQGVGEVGGVYLKLASSHVPSRKPNSDTDTAQ